MQGNRSRDTRPEVKIRSQLHRAGLRFRKNTRPERTVRCEADIVFSRERVAVFVDGCFWHSCPLHGRIPSDRNGYWAAKLGRNAERDERNNLWLTERGWLVLRFWEHEDPSTVVSSIQAAVKSRRS